MKHRDKGLQMGVKMETPAKVNPDILTQAVQDVIYDITHITNCVQL